MHRLFIAIDLPPEIQQGIGSMGASIAGAKAVPEQQLHLTLKFLGDIESGMAHDIDEALARINHPAMELSLNGVGTFPPRGIPRVLWIGVSPQDKVSSLRRKVETSMAGLGLPRDKKKFTPHITIARLKNPQIKRLQQFLAGNAFFHSPPFTIDRFHLYHSQLTAKGAIHTRVQSYDLYSHSS